MNEALSAQELAKEGTAAYQRGDYLSAARAFQAAAQAFEATGDVIQAAEMHNNCSVAFLLSGEAEAALQAVEGTPAIFAAANDLRRQGMALGNQASALEALNRLEEAVQAYQQSAELLGQVGEDKLRAETLKSLSSLQLRMGRQLEALATMQDGIAGIERPSLKERWLKRLLNIPFEWISKRKS